MRMWPALLLILSLGLTPFLGAQEQPARKKSKKKPKKEIEITQTLEVTPDPPVAVTAETARLSFYVSPLSARGLLSQQTRDALKAVRVAAHGAQIVKLRAFVAGTGDLRRVASIVSDVFTEARLPLPSVSTVLVGALPLDGAQLVLEAVAVEKKAVNPQGLAFFSGQLVRATEEKPRPMMEVAGESLANLEKAMAAAAVTSDNILRTTCFVSVLENGTELQGKLAAKFPKAAHNIVQLQRVTGPSAVECEAVGRMSAEPEGAVEFVNPAGLSKSAAYTQLVRVKGGRLVFTTTQQSFGFDDAAMKLAMTRLQKMLETQQAGFSQVVMAHGYALSNRSIAEYRKVRGAFYSAKMPPASTLLAFEGLPSSDAVFGLDVIAAIP
jgi:enamine deaminase RidA (YjgF/YER057c/UK114 family)